MDRACANAAILADWLAARPEVTSVHYPGLPDHPQAELVRRQMRLPGAMLSFQVRGGGLVANRVAGATRVFTLAESLGAVESLIEVPAAMTHASVAGSPLEVPPDLIRLSVGIEAVEDLVADLEQALAAE
jgi:cystathionine gamma-synthase